MFIVCIYLFQRGAVIGRSSAGGSHGVRPAKHVDVRTVLHGNSQRSAQARHARVQPRFRFTNARVRRP